MKKAIVFGASGFIGSYLLQDLLADSSYDQVTVVVRKDLGIKNPKLKTVIGDYKSLPSLKSELKAEDVFIALGTTVKNTPDRAAYYDVDHNYPVLGAKLSQEMGADSVFVVSAVGSDAQSKVFYIRTKGEMERDIIALGFKRTGIFQPSMLLGNRKEHRTMEKTLITIWPMLHPLMFGGLKKFRGTDGKDVAKAMIKAAKEQSEKVKFYDWQDMNP